MDQQEERKRGEEETEEFDGLKSRTPLRHYSKSFQK